VLGGVREGQPRRRRELLDRALALGQQVEHRKPRPAFEGAADPREVLEELRLGRVVARRLIRLITWSSQARPVLRRRRCSSPGRRPDAR
jgi:hypothetical protein